MSYARYKRTRPSEVCYKIFATVIMLILSGAIVMAIVPEEAPASQYLALKVLGWLSFFALVGGFVASIWEL